MSLRRTRWFNAAAFLLAAGLVLSLPGVTRAEDKALAKKLNAEAETLFNLGRFREAAITYQHAYAAKPVPEFLYNIGQCFKRLGSLADLEKAVFYYESYINNVPSSPQRSSVEDELAQLKKEIAARREAAGRRPFYKRWWFWTLVGAAVTGATVGTVLALQPKDQEPIKGTIGEPSPLQLP